MSFCRGDYDSAVESISAIRAAADRCGGSVAQCDLIHLTLLEAALRGRRERLARTLADERTARKPASRLNRWLEARALTSGNDRAGSLSARRAIVRCHGTRLVARPRATNETKVGQG